MQCPGNISHSGSRPLTATRVLHRVRKHPPCYSSSPKSSTAPSLLFKTTQPHPLVKPIIRIPMVTAMAAPPAANGAPTKPKQKLSKNQLRREKKKLKKQQKASREGSAVTDSETESVSLLLVVRKAVHRRKGASLTSVCDPRNRRKLHQSNFRWFLRVRPNSTLVI